MTRKLNFEEAAAVMRAVGLEPLELREERGLMPYLSPEQMPQKGWTETVDASEIDLPSIWSKIEEFSRLVEERKKSITA